MYHVEVSKWHGYHYSILVRIWSAEIFRQNWDEALATVAVCDGGSYCYVIAIRLL